MHCREPLGQNDCRSKLSGCWSNLGWQDEEQREGHDASAGCAAIQQCCRSVKGNGRRDGKRGGLKAVIVSRISCFFQSGMPQENVIPTDPVNESVFHGGGLRNQGWVEEKG